jgi:hypothetical protein
MVCDYDVTLLECRARSRCGRKEGLNVAIRITDIRQAGGTGHEHISLLWWTNPATGQDGDNTRAEIVSWIEDKNGKAYVEDARGNRADVLVIAPPRGEKYLRTYADGRWTDNLLALPRK